MKIILHGKEAKDYLEYLNKKEDVALLQENDIQSDGLTQPTPTDISISQFKENVQDTNLLDVSNTEDQVREALKEMGLGLSDNKSASRNILGDKEELVHWYPIVGKEKFKSTISSIQKAFPDAINGSQWDFRIARDFFTFVSVYSGRADFSWKRLSKVSKGVTSNKFHSPIWYKDKLDKKDGKFTLDRYNAYLRVNKYPDYL